MARGVRRLPADDLAWLAVIPAAVLLLAALLWLAPPLSNLYPDPAYPFFPEIRPIRIDPEPLETTRFLLAITAPILLGATVLAFGGTRPNRRALDLPAIGAQLVVLAFAVWMVLAQRDNASIEFLGAFHPLLLAPGVLWAAPVIGLALVLIALGWSSASLNRARDLAGRIAAWPGGIALSIAVALTAIWLLPGVITDASLSESGVIPPGHVPIQFDEFVAASNGRTPLVDYVPWYSTLLPVALAPIFPIFDHSVTSFTVVMSVLSLLGLIAIYAALRDLTRSPWSALALYVPFMAGALQPWSIDGAVREFNGSYYAVMPERYLGPFLVAWLCARHLRDRKSVV